MIFFAKLIILLIMISSMSHSFVFTNADKAFTNFSIIRLATSWFEENKSELASMDNGLLKLKLQQELKSKMNANIDPKTFKKVLSMILDKKKKAIFLKKLKHSYKKLYSIRVGK